MRQRTQRHQDAAELRVKDIRRKTRKRYSAEEKIRIVLAGLRVKNPTLPSGHRKNRHHQWFTPDLGHPRLKEHLAAVIALMRASANWGQFQRNFKRAFPVQNDQFEMRLGDD